MKNFKLKQQIGYKSGQDYRFKDSVRTTESMEVLSQARDCFDHLDEWRRRSRRCRNYYFGEQWSDLVPNPEYKTRPNAPRYITESQHIMMQGKAPLKNNMIRQLGKAVIGQFAGAIAEPMAVAADRDDQTLGEMATVVMQYNYTLNELKELDKRMLERLLISGVCAAKITHGYSFEHRIKDTWVEAINPNYLFWDAQNSDLRLWDLNMIGEIHDMTIEDVVASFATDSQTANAIRKIYGLRDFTSTNIDNLSSRPIDDLDFTTPSDPSLCRVIEVWRRETRTRWLCHDWATAKFFKIEKNERKYIDAENASRLEFAQSKGILSDDVALIEIEPIQDRIWYARWLTPWGEVLREMESPYEHGSHPYILTLYPNYDNEVHSFVEDILDQQRYINRLITLFDFIMGASAKGVLLIPEDSIPDNMTPADIADEWVRYNGVIIYKAKPGVQPPSQVSSNSTNIGVLDMLQTQLQLITEISGVSGALQGKQAKSGTASSLYAQESQNSANNLVDILTTFNSFRERRDKKMLQVDLQFYDYPHYINICGRDYSEEAKHYDPDKIRGVSFDLRISEAVDTPAFRQKTNEVLLQLFQAQKITLEQMLDCGAFPFADKLMRHLKADEANQQQQAMLQQAMMQQEQQGQQDQQQDPRQLTSDTVAQLPGMPQQPENIPYMREIPTPNPFPDEQQ
jgi:hypothetical protein